MNMVSTAINVALSLVIFASTLDSKPVTTMDRSAGLDTSVDSAFCTVILNEARPSKNCTEDRRYTVEWVRSDTKVDASISVVFMMTDESIKEVQTSPNTLNCTVDAVAAGIAKACGNLGYISWFHVLDEKSVYASTKTIRVKLTRS